MKLYHGTSYDNALEIEQRGGLVTRQHLARLQAIDIIRGHSEQFYAWLTTSRREANDHGDAIVEFDIPNHFITRSSVVNKPVYLDGNIASAKRGHTSKICERNLVCW